MRKRQAEKIFGAFSTEKRKKEHQKFKTNSLENVLS